MPALTILPFGIRRFLPAMRNKAQIIDINIDEIATFKGDDLPKNRAISRPDENPAPIAVPMYNAAVLNAFFTAIAYFENGKYMTKSMKKARVPRPFFIF